MADSRKRQSRKKRGRTRGSNAASNNKRQWQLQQTKVTFRNIEDSSKFGTCHEILTMISTLIDRANAQIAAVAQTADAHQLLIQLDIKSVEMISDTEELIKADEEEAKKSNDIVVVGVADEKEDGAENEATKDDEGAAASAKFPKEAAPPIKSMADIVKGPVVVAADQGPVITARALYVVPAKKSHRRGEKSGCAYLVLTAPPPPEPTVAPLISLQEAPKSTDVAVEAAAPVVESTSTEKESATKTAEGVDALTEGVGEMKIVEDSAEQKKDELNTSTPATITDEKKDESNGKVVDVKDAPASKSNVALYTAAEKSRLTAVAKLQLLNAINVLTNVIKDDDKDRIYGNCQVAASASGKAWRDKEGGHRDRREGTIETTGDYKQFFNKQSKAQEERMSRPKPAPGGGGAMDGSGDAGSNQPMSAIVLHLRAKHQEQNKRKKASKKASKDAKKGGKQPVSSSGASNKDGKRRSSNNNSSKSGHRGRKDGKKSGGGGTQAPVTVMKAKHNASAVG